MDRTDRPRPARRQGQWWLTFLKNLVPSFFETALELAPDIQLRRRRWEALGLPVRRLDVLGWLVAALAIAVEGVRRLVLGELGFGVVCLAVAVGLALTARWRAR